MDAAGDVYVTGFTDSTNFPVNESHFREAQRSAEHSTSLPTVIWLMLLSQNWIASGSNLIYSTYLGGAGADAAYGIALDSSNNAYVTGFTYSTNFPTTPTAFQKNLQVTNWAYQAYFNANAFVTEIGAGGSNLLYSTYLGGTNYDWGKGIAVDISNNVYVTGFTASTNFPTTNAMFNSLSRR